MASRLSTSDSDSVSPADRPAHEAVLSRFAGKTLLTRGASDRGIGGAIAERLAREGASLAMIGRHQPKRLLKRLDRAQAQSFYTHCDITKADEVTAAVKQSLAHFGRI